MSIEQDKLRRRLNAGEISSNEFDVLWEIATFEPCEQYRSVRANNAGTKVIYTMIDGAERTHWAQDWSRKIDGLITSRALKDQEGAEHG